MKKFLTVLLAVFTLACLAGCGKNISEDAKPSEPALITDTEAAPSSGTSNGSVSEETSSPKADGLSSDSNTDEPGNDTKILVVYFSATGNTRPIAEYIAGMMGADIFEIVPEIPYTDEDLDYNKSCRANAEQNDDAARPAIEGSIDNLDDYKVVFIGYPIWWGKEPRIIDTFMESYDLSGKTLVNFCTSGSSEISTSTGNLMKMCKNANWLEGRRFAAGASEETVREWVETLNLRLEQESTKLGIQVGDIIMSATPEDNSSAEALIEQLKNGPITIEMEDYANFEKVGPLGMTLPRNDEQITTEPGDVILYLGNQITIYYDTNSWNFTRLARIDGLTQEELKTVLGDGSVTVTFMLQ